MGQPKTLEDKIAAIIKRHLPHGFDEDACAAEIVELTDDHYSKITITRIK